MSILPGLDLFLLHNHRSDDLAGMITQLIEQANANYLKYLAAAATDKREQVWARFHESFKLEADIDTLTIMYDLMARSNTWRLPEH